MARLTRLVLLFLTVLAIFQFAPAADAACLQAWVRLTVPVYGTAEPGTGCVGTPWAIASSPEAGDEEDIDGVGRVGLTVRAEIPLP